MTIKIKLNVPKQKPVQAQIELKITKTLDGNLIIDDHEYMDIVVNPTEGKIISLPKPYAEKDVYDYQRELMYHLFKGGVTEAVNPKGGIAFGMMETPYIVDSTIGVNSLQAVLLLISEYVKKSASDDEFAKEYDKHVEDRFVDPSETETTEPGSIPPHEDNPEAYQIGDPTYSFAGYGYLY
jgi:hypothetical protein